MKIAIKEVGKELSFAEVSDKYRLACVKKYTGRSDPAEFVSLSLDGRLTLAVNENGLPLHLPTNFLMAMNNPHFPVQKMVGTVVFTRIKPVETDEEIWDYELTDLTDEDIKKIRFWLEP